MHEAPLPPHPASITILVVDDRATSRELIARTLGREGYRILEAADGPAALEMVDRHEPDLVLLDVMMPGMDGFEVLERIRELHPWPRVAVVLLSAVQTGPVDQARALDAGAEGFIARPVDPRELTARIRSHLRTLFLAHDLEASEARAREVTDLLDQSRDAIFVLDPDGVILAWSGGAERMYGTPSSQAVGRRLEEVVVPETGDDPEELARVRARIEDSLASGSWQGELRHRTATGRLITVEGRWTVVPGSTPGRDRVICVNTDVTERRRLFDAWQSAERFESLGMLAGGLAHDLNNALQPLALAAEALVEATDSDPRVRELARTVGEQARRSTERVERLLHLSRSLEGTRGAVPLRPLLAELLSEIREETGDRVDLLLEDPEGPDTLTAGVASGNERLLKHLFQSLLRNAVEAVPLERRGSVRVTLAPAARAGMEASPFFPGGRGAGVEIRITDTGEGMSPEVLERAATPLFTTREEMGHTGLGLTVATRITRVHGGALRLDSSPGKGTTVRVILPAAEGDAEASSVPGAPAAAVEPAAAAKPEAPPEPAPLAPAPPPEPGTGRTILVIDDDAAIRMVTRRALSAHGYTVRVAAGGEEALALYREDPRSIGLLIVDMMMPGMDGPATIRAFRELDPSLPAIGASGLLAPPAGADEGAPPLVNHFLAKPFSVAQLLEVVRGFLTPPEG